MISDGNFKENDFLKLIKKYLQKLKNGDFDEKNISL